jgi:Arc/MetJ-type ribon-helix-helix transcriptional regulator
MTQRLRDVVTFDALFARSDLATLPALALAGELRSSQNALELGDRRRADHLDAVVHTQGVLQSVIQSAVMPRTVQARLDKHAEEDLALLRNEGHNDSEAIRLALREAAERRRRKSALRLEAEAAASDPEDLAEARRVRAGMDALAAPWPES